MRYIQVTDGLNVPVIALGCMRIADMQVQDVAKLVETAVARLSRNAEAGGNGRGQRGYIL